MMGRWKVLCEVSLIKVWFVNELKNSKLFNNVFSEITKTIYTLSWTFEYWEKNVVVTKLVDIFLNVLPSFWSKCVIISLILIPSSAAHYGYWISLDSPFNFAVASNFFTLDCSDFMLCNNFNICYCIYFTFEFLYYCLLTSFFFSLTEFVVRKPCVLGVFLQFSLFCRARKLFAYHLQITVFRRNALPMY